MLFFLSRDDVFPYDTSPKLILRVKLDTCPGTLLYHSILLTKSMRTKNCLGLAGTACVSLGPQAISQRTTFRKWSWKEPCAYNAYVSLWTLIPWVLKMKALFGNEFVTNVRANICEGFEDIKTFFSFSNGEFSCQTNTSALGEVICHALQPRGSSWLVEMSQGSSGQGNQSSKATHICPLLP